MHALTKVLVSAWLLAGPCTAVARADGGTVQMVERQGDYQISIFTSPNPLRAGPIDVSVLVQNAETGQTIGDTHIALRLTAREMPRTSLLAVATSTAATNKLMQAALVDLPAAGRWDVNVDCTTNDGTTQMQFAMEALPPLPRWLTVWPWFTWHFAVVMLFAVHRRLVRLKRAHGTTRLPEKKWATQDSNNSEIHERQQLF